MQLEWAVFPNSCKPKQRWWSMPAPYGDWSSWCWSCPYFDCMGVVQLRTSFFLWKSNNRTSMYGFWQEHIVLDRLEHFCWWTVFLHTTVLEGPRCSLNLWHLLITSQLELLAAEGIYPNIQGQLSSYRIHPFYGRHDCSSQRWVKSIFFNHQSLCLLQHSMEFLYMTTL